MDRRGLLGGMPRMRVHWGKRREQTLADHLSSWCDTVHPISLKTIPSEDVLQLHSAVCIYIYFFSVPLAITPRCKFLSELCNIVPCHPHGQPCPIAELTVFPLWCSPAWTAVQSGAQSRRGSSIGRQASGVEARVLAFSRGFPTHCHYVFLCLALHSCVY